MIFINIKPDELWIEKFDEMFYDALDKKYTNYILPGGRGSTKSSFIAFMVVLLIINNPSSHAIIFRKVGNTLKTSVYGQMMWAIEQLGMNHLFTFHTNPLEIIFKPTKQKILFFGLDDASKVKSVKLPFGYIAVTWFEELDQYSGEREIRKVLQSTMRGGNDYWNFMSFNPPISQNNWANEYTLNCEMYRKDDTKVIRSTYLDVPKDWLGSAFIDEADYLKETNERAYKNEMLGIPIGSGGNVFYNVEDMHMDNELVSTFDYIYNGLDWGYAIDPNAAVKAYYDSKKHDLYIFAEYTSKYQGNKDLYTSLYEDQRYLRLNEFGEEERVPFMQHNELIWADSAESKSIGDFRAWGCYMRAVNKFKNSPEYGIKWLQSLSHIYIDKERCPAAFTEFIKYEYDRDREGQIISRFPDKNNHFIDATRYALMPLFSKRGK